MKRVPKSFVIGAFTFTVVRASKESLEQIAGQPVYAVFLPELLQIFVVKKTPRIQQSVILQSFWHEFGHAVLWCMNHRDWKNERTVDQLGHNLAQFHATVKF